MERRRRGSGQNRRGTELSPREQEFSLLVLEQNRQGTEFPPVGSALSQVGNVSPISRGVSRIKTGKGSFAACFFLKPRRGGLFIARTAPPICFCFSAARRHRTRPSHAPPRRRKTKSNEGIFWGSN